MADNIYWTNKKTTSPKGRTAIKRRTRPGTDKKNATTTPQWWAFGIAGH